MSEHEVCKVLCGPKEVTINDHFRILHKVHQF